jgi:hypothetical protein
VASWPTVPDPIREAVKAVLSPYMITDGQKQSSNDTTGD